MRRVYRRGRSAEQGTCPGGQAGACDPGAERLGVKCGAVQVDLSGVMGHIRDIIDDFARRDSAESLEQKGIVVYQGAAAFEAYDTVRVDNKPINGQRFVIATGSRPLIPEIPGLAEAGYLDTAKIWSLSSLPAHLIVVGAEPSGLELAQCFSRLGSKVTVVTIADRILARGEPEASDFVMKALAAEGIVFKLGVEITKVEVRDGQKVCKYRETSGGAEATGEISGSDILVATGRMANVEGMNLDAVGVHGDAQHGIEVDDCLQTHSTRVYALGDVLLRHPYTHVAEKEATVVFQNAVLRLRKKMDYSRTAVGDVRRPRGCLGGNIGATGDLRRASVARFSSRFQRDRSSPDRRPDRRIREVGCHAIGQDPGRDGRRRGGCDDRPGVCAGHGRRSRLKRYRFGDARLSLIRQRWRATWPISFRRTASRGGATFKLRFDFSTGSCRELPPQTARRARRPRPRGRRPRPRHMGTAIEGALFDRRENRRVSVRPRTLRHRDRPSFGSRRLHPGVRPSFKFSRTKNLKLGLTRKARMAHSPSGRPRFGSRRLCSQGIRPVGANWRRFSGGQPRIRSF